MASVLGDRMRRDRALALGYLLQSIAALLCGVALLVAPAPIAYATAVLSACAITLTRPVHNAILPDLAVTPGELTAANSVSSSAEGIGITVGPLVNAMLISWGGPASVLLVAAGVMLVVAIATSRLNLREGESRAHAGHGLVHDALEGIRALRDDLPAAGLPLFVGAQFVVLGMLDIFLAVLAIDVLGVGEQGAGVLAAGIGLGGLLGAAATAVLVGRRRLATPIQIAVGAASGATASLALVSVFGRAILVLVAAGAARTFFDVGGRTLLQRSVPADVLSRVFGLQEAMHMLGLAVGSALAPVFIALFGYRGAFVAAGIILLAAGVFAWPAMHLLDRRAMLPDPDRFALLRSLDLFAPLAQRVLEQLTVRAVPATASAGDVLIREGDPGDRFYVITSGTTEVETGGAHVATVGPGEYVGEIALLRDVPRTATVRALTDLELLVLEREDFLEAVTGSRRSTRAASAQMDRRLNKLGEEQT